MAVRRRTWLTLLSTVALIVPAYASIATTVVIPPGGGPHVRVWSGTNGDGGFFAYDPQFGGGVNVAVGDVLGDTQPEIVTGAGVGGGPHVRIFDLAGNPVGGFFAYGMGYGGGVSVAVGDVTGDAKAEIVTAPAMDGGPHVRVFDGAGNERSGFFAYDQSFTAGVRVAVGEVSGGGPSEIVVGPAPGGGPHVRVFGGAGDLRSEWFAYDPAFPGGVNVAADGGRVVTAPVSRGGPHVRVFNGSGAVTNEWFAYDPGFAGGVQVAAGAVQGSPAVVTGAGPTGGPHVRVFNPSGSERHGFLAYDPGYTGGVTVAVGGDRVVTGAGVPRTIEILRRGDRGPAVADLQHRLLRMGYWLPGVDGVFGDTTQQAVWAFQKFNGLKRDGVIDQGDQAALARGQRPVASIGGDLIEVDKSLQLLLVVRDGEVLWAFNTSTGNNGSYKSGGRTYRAVTPEGHFRFERQINGMRVSRLGELFRPKYFTSVGHAIHGSPSIPPYPASHGCVRLHNTAINYIWDAGLAPLGSRIWVHS